jgi:D-arginine dehydrogenase
MHVTDFIVIGGGIAGISAAAHLARHGTVVVLEAEAQHGYHSTGRSAAIFVRNYGNETLRALNADSAPVLEAPDGISDSSLLSPRGEVMVATEEELPVFEDYMAGSDGLERLSAQQVVELIPMMRPDRIAGAMIEWDAQDIDVDRMLSGYLRQLRHAGGTLVTKARVEDMRRAGGIWTVTAGGQRYQAPVVVNAAGGWAGAVGDMAGGVAVPLTPYRRSAAIVPGPEGADVMAWPMVCSASETWYAKPEAGKLMVSPADEDPVEPHDVWAEDMVLAEGIHRFEQMVTLEVTRVEHSWAGMRSFVPDRSPVVGFDPQAEGLFWLAGQGGYGVQTAPALAALTEALVTGSDPGLAAPILSALTPHRFTKD